MRRADATLDLVQCVGSQRCLLCRAFNSEGPFWGRDYIFYTGGRPLTLIYEVFSTQLEEYLGPLTASKEP